MNLKVINNLTKKSNDNLESNTNTQSLTSKMRFFELFIKNKNLIKQGF